MPEGPEIRTSSDQLKLTLVNKVITGYYKDDKAKTVGFDINLKCPATIISVRSYGKKLIFDLDSGHMIITSFKMTGLYQYVAGNHSHVRFDLAEYEIRGSFKILKPTFSLYYDDVRNMGDVDVIPNNGANIYFRDQGPDLLYHALDEKTWISLEVWLSIYNSKNIGRRKIIDILLDQSLVCGIGLYLVTDILYYSGIHPLRLANTLGQQDWDLIRINAHKVIVLSYSYGGLTIKDFISPDGQRGMYPTVIYGKTHDPNGFEIVNEKMSGGRTAHYVREIQV